MSTGTAEIPFAIKIPGDEIASAARTRVSYEEPEPTKADLIPAVSVTGFRLLIKLLTVEKKIGSIYRPDDEREREQVATILGKVIQKGPLAFMDKVRFPDGNHWCNLGDVIVMKSYAGDRLSVDGEEYRIINDDQVTAVVHDPARVSRA